MVEITDDEAALYDRQIRLWGVDAQRSLRAANVFVKRCGPLVSKCAALFACSQRVVKRCGVNAKRFLRTANVLCAKCCGHQVIYAAEYDIMLQNMTSHREV
jgi:hypothetical protein